MLNRLTLLLCALVFMVLAACGGAKAGTQASYDDDGAAKVAPVRVDELNQAQKEAVGLTEENHKMAREVFELKNRLGLPTDE